MNESVDSSRERLCYPNGDSGHVLLYHPSFEPLAKRIVSDPTLAGRVHLSQISWEAFADKFPKLRIVLNHLGALLGPRMNEAAVER